MSEIAQSSGVAVIDRGATWLVIDRGTGSAAVALFVLGLIVLIGGGAGVTLVATVGLGGLVPLALGVLASVAFVAVWRWKRRREEAPPEEARLLCAIDRGAGTLVSAAGYPLAYLAQVRLHRRFQIGSSSPALEIQYPGGALRIVRGNPFAGGIHDVEHVLRQVLPH